MENKDSSVHADIQTAVPKLIEAGYTLIAENRFMALFQSGVYLTPEAEQPYPVQIVFRTASSDAPYLCIGCNALEELDMPEAIYKRFGEKYGCRYFAGCWTKDYHSVEDMAEVIAFLHAIAEKNLDWRKASGKTAEHTTSFGGGTFPPSGLIAVSACDKTRKLYTPKESITNPDEHKSQICKTLFKVIFQEKPLYFISESHPHLSDNTLYDNNGRFLAFRCKETAFRYVGLETGCIEWNADAVGRFITGKETAEDIAELPHCYSICESLSGISADNADDTASEEQLLSEDRARIWLRIAAKKNLQAFPDSEIKETVIRIMSTGMQTFMNVIGLTDINEDETAPYPDIPDEVIKEALKNRSNVSDVVKQLHDATGMPDHKILDQIRRYMKTVMKLH